MENCTHSTMNRTQGNMARQCSSRSMPEHSCDKFMRHPDSYSDDFPIGMAYVPWQKFTKVYDPKRALMAGTIFPELDMPFTAKCMMSGNGGRYR